MELGRGEEPLVAPLPEFGATLPKSMLQNVEAKPTRSFGIRAEENEAYYRLLRHLKMIPADKMRESELEFREDRIDQFEQRMDQKILKEYADDERSQTVLLKKLSEKVEGYRDDPLSFPLVQDAFNDPQSCQGRVISFRGHVRKAVSYPAGENKYGVETLYEIWLFEEDAKGFPVVVVCTELPKGFPLNFPENEPIDGVSVRGYFFKLFAYEGREEFQAVPLLLARSVAWNPPVTRKRTFPGWAYVSIVVIGLVLLFLLLSWSGKTRRELRRTRQRVASPEDNPFADPTTHTESDS